jgi:hypothetical protein
MIGHAMHGQHLGFSGLHKSGHVFMQLYFMFPFDKALPSLYSEDELQVNLGEGIRHGLGELRRHTKCFSILHNFSGKRLLRWGLIIIVLIGSKRLWY